MEKLSGQLYLEFQEALLSAFPDYDKLEQMLRYQIDENLIAIAGDGALNTVVFNLIKWAEANGQLDKLIEGARISNPGNRALFIFEEKYKSLNLLESPLMLEHYFISYSSADALDSALKLAKEMQSSYPITKIWLDKLNLKSDKDWGSQITEAIQTCKALILILTTDSVTESSVCKQEWDLALRYKKPIVLLRLHSDVLHPLSLGNRKVIDFSLNFDSGLAHLRRHIEWLDTPEGKLQEVKNRLSDAKRALNLASPEDRERIKYQIGEIETDIQRREKTLSDPKAATARTERKILIGLEQERGSEKTDQERGGARYINPIPAFPPKYFQNRSVETRLMCAFLDNPAQRLMTIIGRGGIGKTAMICRLLKHLEVGTLPDNLENDFSSILIDGIVYLSNIGTHRVNFFNLFNDLCKLLPANQSAKLENIYKDVHRSVYEKTLYLLECFHQGQYLVLLDNFETSLDAAECEIYDLYLKDALNAILCGPHHSIKVILTSRIIPRSLSFCEPSRQVILPLDKGLESPYAENILREMDTSGIAGLKDAPDDLLAQICTRTRGFPRALEAVVALLTTDYNTKIEDLLDGENASLPEMVVQNLVGDAFSRLDSTHQKVMQALAIYNRPVPSVAVDYLLQPFLTDIDGFQALQHLVNMHFVRKELGRFYLHPVDREFAFNRIPVKALHEGSFESFIIPEWHQKYLLNRAADYFAQTRKPSDTWKGIDDLYAPLAEFELRYAAEDYDGAAEVVSHIDFDYLLLWSYYQLTCNLCLMVKDKIKDKKTKVRNLYGLGTAYRNIGNSKEAVLVLEQALALSREIQSQDLESGILGGLGTTYASLGETVKAIRTYEQGLKIARQIGNLRRESNITGNIGNRYAELGEIDKAIQYHKKGLETAHKNNDKYNAGNWMSELGESYILIGKIHQSIQANTEALITIRSINNRTGEIYCLQRLGKAYLAFGDVQNAIKFFEQASEISDEIGYRHGQARNYAYIAEALLEYGNLQDSIKCSIKSSKIADEIEFPLIQGFARWIEAQSNLLLLDFVSASSLIQHAKSYYTHQTNHKILSLMGIICIRQNDIHQARTAFQETIVDADNLLAKTQKYHSALDAKGLALCGLALLTEEPLQTSPLIEAAIQTFQEARKITKAAGIIKPTSRMLGQLEMCDNGKLLNPIYKMQQRWEKYVKP